LLRQIIELTVSLFIVAVLAWALWESRAWPPQSRLFPWSIGITVLGLALVQLGIGVRNALRSEPALEGAVSHTPQSFGQSEEASRSRQGDIDRTALRRRVISVQVWIVIFFLGIWL
jgi:hypothetical protein